ncbi:hypothetical protein HanIR_Chr01g0048881 [Helianthus annuus]|nr:hypothetical protein HanIR_Chr01g0048881 [Helianthus annuus]
MAMITTWVTIPMFWVLRPVCFLSSGHIVLIFCKTISICNKEDTVLLGLEIEIEACKIEEYSMHEVDGPEDDTRV